MELEELIRSIDIVEYISQYVELTQKGDEWWGLSCFKAEKTPSFSVRKDPPFFYDYSSGIGGNLYKFIIAIKHCSSKEAIEEMKKFAGFDGEVSISSATSKMAATLDCKKFMRKPQTIKQSKSTVLADNFMERYSSNPEKLVVWESEGISKEVLDKFQVKYDEFSDRLVYPIRNLEGKIVNIGGRTLDPKWKEKELRKYCYFYSWGTIDTLYGLAENMDEILKKKEVIIFEGCKSVLIAHSWGIKNTVAILTSHLNPHQMKILARLGCRVVFALDKEIDITQDKNIQKLKRYVNVETVFDKNGLLGDKDAPVDRGPEIFKNVYDNRKKFR